MDGNAVLKRDIQKIFSMLVSWSIDDEGLRCGKGLNIK